MSDELDTSAAVSSYLNSRQPQEAARTSYTLAAESNPDAEAEYRRLAKEAGIPIDSVRDNKEAVQRQVSAPDFNDLAAKFPSTTAYLSNIENARIAHDDVAGLTEVEKAIRSSAAGKLTSSKGLQFLSNTGSAGLSGLQRASAGVVGLAQAPFDLLAPVLDPLTGTVLPENPLRRVAAGMSAYRQGIEAQSKANMPKADGILESGYYSGIGSLASNLAVMPLALLPGGQGAALAGMTAPVGGGAYGEARDKGLNPGQAAVFGGSQAVIEYATEKLPLSKLIGDIKAGTPFFKTLAKQIALEVPGEQLATVLQDLNEWAALNPTKSFNNYLQERPNAAAQTLIATIIGTGGQVTVMKAVQNVLDRTGNANLQSTSAQEAAARAENIVKAVQAVKLATRDSTSFQEFVNDVAEDGDAPAELFINADTLTNTLNQAGITMERLQMMAPAVAAQLRNASFVPGADIRVPVAEFAAAGADITTPLIDHLRETPDAMSRAEAQQYLATEGDRIQSEVETEMGKMGDRIARRQEIDTVAARFEAELNAAGKFRPEVNKAYASLMGNFYAAQATRAGMPLEDFLQKYQLRVTGKTGQGAQTLEQAERVRPELRALAEAALAEGNKARTVELFPVDAVTIAEAREKGGFDLAGFTHTADMFSVRHALNRHSDPKTEESRAQIPLTADDVGAVGEVIESPDIRVYGALTPRKQQIVASIKRLADGSLLVAEEVRTGRKTLALTSLRKYPAARDFSSIAKTLLSNAQSDGGKLILVDVAAQRNAPENREPKGTLAQSGQAQAAINPIAVAQQSADPETGLPQFAGSNGLFIGFAAPTERLEFIPTDDSLQMLNFVIMRDGQMIGSADLLFEGDKLAALYDIEVDKAGRGKGDGAAVIQTLLAADPLRDVQISNIVESARGFWESVGIPQQNLGPGEAYDGNLNWQTYLDSRAGQRAARGNDGAGASTVSGADASATGPGQSGDGQAGNQLNQSAVDQTATPQFKKWFGDSEVVDDAGKPLLIYRGESSGARRDVYDRSKSRENAIFMTPDRNVAKGYEKNGEPRAFYVKADRLLDLTEDTPEARKFITEWSKNWDEWVDRESGESIDPVDAVLDGRLFDYEGDWSSERWRDLQATALENHDAAYLPDWHDGPFKALIVRGGSQIKSATDNSGAFDPTNPNILKQPAYHGSPHDFNRFSTDNIGTGEGNQSYGWGLYFAENKDVAAGYHKSLAMRYDGRTPAEIRAEIKNVKATMQGPRRGDMLRELDAQLKMALESTRKTGGVYQVDIPDEAVASMLLWDKPLSEQPEAAKAVRVLLLSDKVEQRALDDFDVASKQDLADKLLNEESTGEELYGSLEDVFGGDKAASKALAAAGVPGIKYLDQGSRNAGDWTLTPPTETTAGDWMVKSSDYNSKGLHFATESEARAVLEEKRKEGTSNLVVFDDRIIKLTHKDGSPVTTAERNEYLQSAQGGAPRATLNFASDITQAPSVIALLEGADLSSFLHESGHFFLEVQADLAARIQLRISFGDAVSEAERGIVADMNTLLEWFGVTDMPEASALDQWAMKTLEERREAHETFARGFEKYAMEGRAPTQELQGLFNKFRSWLVSIYHKLASLNVHLTDDVRGVMDRMLASDEAIAEAQAARNMGPLFQSPEQAGMTPAEYDTYQFLGERATAAASEELDARLMKDMKWLSRAKSKAIKAAQAEADDIRRDTEREVRAEVMTQPVYRAWAFLTGKQDQIDPGTVAPEAITGTESGKLRTSLVKDIDPEVWSRLSERRMTSEDRGMHPDIVAEVFGFTSGDELVRKLAAAPPPAQLIAEQTDQLMMERYGDITSAAALSQAADEAVHNELRARVIATELKALQKAGQVLTGDRNTVNVLAKAAKEYAAQVIARQRVRDLRPSQYTAAEARSAKLAEQALGKDMAEAALHKRNQLINNYAARAAYDAQDEVKAMQAYFRKFDKRRESIDPGYQDQIEALLERFDFKPASLKAIDKRKSFAAWYEEQSQGDNPPDVPDYLLDEAGRKSYKNMTVEELRGLRDTVKQIEHQGRLKNKLLLARDKRDFDAAATAMADSIIEHGGEARPVQLEGPSPVTDWFAGVAASHRKLASLFRQMDGNQDDGPMYDLIGRGMNERGTMEDVMVEKATVALRDIYAPLMKMRGGITGSRSKLYIPEINASLTRGGRLAVALNWGNEANRQRIMDGDKWSQGQVQAILKTLSPVELKFVNDIWAYIDSYWEDIAAKEKRLTGVEPEKVQAQPFTQVAADGTEVQMRGGYYPLKYDTDRSDRADTQEAAQAAKEMMQGVMTKATTRRGHTKERLKEVKRAVRKDLNVITQHITQVTHDLAWHEWLIDTNKLLKDERVVNAIRDHYGPKVLKTIRDDVLGIATADVVPQTDIDKALLTLRGNVTRATMGASITTAFLQPFGLTQSMVRIGPQHVLRGVARWGGDAARMENTVEWIRGKSEFMRLRAKTFNRELREIRGAVAGKSAAMRVVDAGLFALMQKMQLVADVPTWIGQYEKSMSEGLDEAAAVAMADRAVLESQGGGATKDLAQVQRKHPMLTQFYSYFSVTLNLAAEQTAATDFKNPAAVAGWLGDMALLMVIPAILPSMILFALKGGDEDDEKGWAKRIAEWQLGYLMSTAVGIRELSGAVSGFDYAGPPVSRIVTDIGKAGTQTIQGEVDEPAVMAYIRLMGTTFGIPTVQALRSYKGWKAWDEGQEGAGPQSVLFGPPPRD